jgi:hypothetical protein
MFDSIAPSPSIINNKNAIASSPSFVCEDEKGNTYVLSAKRMNTTTTTTSTTNSSSSKSKQRTIVTEKEFTITSDRSRRAAQHAANVSSLEGVKIFSTGISSSSFEAKTLEVSRQGNYAILSGNTKTDEEEGTGKENTTTTCGMYIIRLSQHNNNNNNNNNNNAFNNDRMNGNNTYEILAKYFENASPTTTVLSAKFCPGTEESIALLTSDGYFRIMNFTKSCAAAEQIWKLDPLNEHSSSTPIRPQVVDFTFGPTTNGCWGRFTVFFLCAENNKIKYMCPVVASGSRTSSRVLEEVVKSAQTYKNSSAALRWLERTFDMSSKASVRVARQLSANAAGGEAVALQDLASAQTQTQNHERDALKIAVRSLSGDGRSDDGLLIATLRTNRVVVSAVTNALFIPSWSTRESRTIDGILHASSSHMDRPTSSAMSPVSYDIDVIKLEGNNSNNNNNNNSDDKDDGIYNSCQKVEWDQFTRQRLFVTLKGSAHSIDLRWLPILEAAIAREEGLKLDTFSNDLPLPEVRRVLTNTGNGNVLGAISLGDPLEAGLILAIHSTKGVLALTPEDVSTANTSTMDVSKPLQRVVPKNMSESSNVTADSLRKLAKGPESSFNVADTIRKNGSQSFDMTTKITGTEEDVNGEIVSVLSKSFADLKAHHVSFGHRAHDEIRAAGSRLGREISRQIDEATNMAEISNTITNNLDALGARFDDAVERHGMIRARLLALVESERNLPGMLSRAESLFSRQLETYKGDVGLIESRVDELVDRVDIVCGEDEKIGYVGTGKLIDNEDEDVEGEISLSDRLLRDELQRQSDAIKANAMKLKIIEKLLLSNTAD